MGLFGGSKTTVGYKYFLGVHLVGCHGPIDAVKKLLFDKKEAWSGNVTANETIDVDADELFGGKDREGGVAGTVDVLMGAPDQPVSAYLQDKQAADVPAYRGVFSLLYRNFYWGNSPYLKNPAVVVKRIHVRQEGIEQWYDEKAEIGAGESTTIEAITRLQTRTIETGSAEDIAAYDLSYTTNIGGTNELEVTEAGFHFTMHAGGAAYVVYTSPKLVPKAGQGLLIEGFIEMITSDHLSFLPYVTFNPDLGTDSRLQIGTGGSPGWGRFETESFGEDWSGYPAPLGGRTHFAIQVTVSDGTHVYVGGDEKYSNGVNVDAYISGDPGQIAQLYIGQITSVGNLECVVKDIAVRFEEKYTSNFTPPDELDPPDGEETSDVEGDMNPAHIIRECLTDPDWGMGYSEADIDDTAFMAAADTLWNEGMGMSLLWDKQVPIEDFIKEVQKHIDSVLYVDRSTGKFVLKLIRNDYVEDDLLLLDPNNVLRVENYSERRFEELVNSVTVKYSNRDALWNEASVELQDLAQVHMQNAVVNTTVNYSGFTRAPIATKAGARDLKTLSTPLATCTIYANQDARELNIGSVFKFTWPDYEKIDEMVMRVTGIAFGDGKDNTIRIQCTQDVFALPDTEYVVTDPGEWADPNAEPAPAAAEVAFEAPYYVALKALGNADVDAALAADADVGFVAVAAVPPETGAINALVSTAAPSSYTDRGTMDFCPSGLLGGAVEMSDVSVTLTDMTGATSIEAGSLALCNDEFWEVVSLVGDTLTIGRAALDTVPANHSIGDRVFFLGSDSRMGFDTTRYTDDDTVNVKVRPITGKGTLALGSAAALPVVMGSRAVRPLPPANVKVNGENYPTAAIEGSLAIEWAHRNRLLQTSDELVTYLDASQSPEAGTTYTFDLLSDDLSTVLDTVSGLTGTTTSLDANYAGVGYVRGRSFRDGYESWQAVIVPVEFAGGNVLLTENDGGLLFEDGEAILLEQDIAEIDSRNFGVYDYQEALPVRTGNRQVVFYRWSGPVSDAGFSANPRPQSFLLLAGKSAGWGEPAVFDLQGRHTAGSGSLPPDILERINSQSLTGQPGDTNLYSEALDAGADLAMYERAGGGPWPSDWCETFDTVSTFYTHCVVFPEGEPVYVPIYAFGQTANDVSAYPGQAGTGTGTVPDDTWWFFGHCSPSFPYPDNARLHVYKGANFISTVTVAVPQINEVFFEDPIVEDDIYAVRLNGLHFQYKALSGDDSTDVLAALAALIDAHADYSASVDPFNDHLYIEGAPAVEFRCEAAIVRKQLELTFEGGTPTDLTGNHVPVLKGTASVSSSSPIDGSYSLATGGTGGCLTIPRVGDKLRADTRDFSYRLKFKLDTLAEGTLAVYGEAPAHQSIAPVLKLLINTNGTVGEYVIYAKFGLAAESGSGTQYTLASEDLLMTGVEYEVELRRTQNVVALFVDGVLVDENDTVGLTGYGTRYLGLDTLRDKPFNIGGYYNINASAAQDGILGKIDSVIVEYSVAYNSFDERA